MVRRVIKYALYTFLVVVVLWISSVFGLYLYLNSQSGQKTVIAYAQSSMKDAGITLNVGKIKGKVPFDFSIDTIELKEEGTTLTKVEGFSLKWHWPSLLYSNIRISSILAKKIDIYNTKNKPKKMPSEGIKKKISKNTKTVEKKNFLPWPKFKSLIVSFTLDNLFIKKLNVYNKSLIGSFSGIKVVGHLTRFGVLDAHVLASIVKPESILFNLHFKAPLNKQKAEMKLSIEESKYGKGEIKGTLKEETPGSLDLKGKLFAHLDKQYLGLLSNLISDLRITFDLIYDLEKIKWHIKGGDGQLVQINKKGVYKQGDNSLSTTLSLVEDGISNLLETMGGRSVKKFTSKTIKSTKDKIKKSLSKHLSKGKAGKSLEGAVEDLGTALKGLF